MGSENEVVIQIIQIKQLNNKYQVTRKKGWLFNFHSFYDI